MLMFPVLMATVLPADTPALVASLLPGTYANEEQVYFDKEAGREGPPWFALRITLAGDKIAISEPDAFGADKDAPHSATWKVDGNRVTLDYGACRKLYRLHEGALVADGERGTCRAPGSITRIAPDRIEMTYSNGQVSQLRRARPASCWVAIRKDKSRADGKEDWLFLRDVKLNDQGGRARAGGGDSGAQEVVIRMRNVVWPQPTTNKPSLVLYVHKPDQPDRAESYVWADPGAARIGINLRWMQASCTIDGAEKASEVSSTTFRG
jgi:hypothetical protein